MKLLYRLKFDFLKKVKNLCESDTDQPDELEICFENGGKRVDENSDKITRSSKLS